MKTLLSLLATFAILGAVGLASATPASAADGVRHSCKRVKALGGVYQVTVTRTRCDNARRWARKMLRSDFEPRGWSYCGNTRQNGYCSGRKGKAKNFTFERIRS